MSTAKSFIRIENRNKKRPDIKYARVCTPQWVGKKKINNEIWLGRVVNIDDSIFYNREKGYFRYTIEDKFVNLSDDEIKRYKDVDKTPNIKKKKVNNNKDLNIQTSIQFGDIYIIDEFINNNNILSLFEFSCPRERDSILSLIGYRIINCKGYRYAEEWYNTSYAKYLYPFAQISSQRISEIMSKIGTERYHRDFFINYINYLQKNGDTNSILIDSTGLPNDIKCNLTAINNHNGVISNEIRLIVVMDKISGFPIYYQYVPGNIVDVSTLQNILYNLQELNVNIDRLILDAGYYSEANLMLLKELKIPFMTRMGQNNSKYDLLVKKFAPIIKKPSNSVNYGSREVFIIKTQIEVFNSQIPLFAYVCLDPNKQHDDYTKYKAKHDYSKITDEQFENDCMKHGIFILISTIDIPIDQLLPCYYSRQSIEQFFDFIKNDSNLLPLRTHKPITFSGHLMISFISTIVSLSIDKKLKEKKLSFTHGLYSLSHHFARVYRNNIIPNVSTKNINDICKALKINIPKQIPLK